MYLGFSLPVHVKAGIERVTIGIHSSRLLYFSTLPVHAQGSKIYLQLWALGRAATGSVLKAEGFDVVSSSNVGLPLNGPTRGDSVPRPLTIAEIKLYQSWYARAATNFVKLAGGDGVEVHVSLPLFFRSIRC